jgi:hypothetical protein
VNDRRTQGAMLLLVGAMALWLGLTDAALAYVRGALRPPLVVSGVVLLVLAGPGPGRPLRAQPLRPVRTPNCIELQLHC